jgi:1,4-alpha-glucan branching enzyme
MYAYNEHFVLALSHDEVVHGKGSLYGKMWGDPWQKRANLRALYALMYAQPGRKLLFMGSELAQVREWNHDTELDWGLLDNPDHAGIQRLVRDLNHLYRSRPALHARDDEPGGFCWIEVNDRAHSIFSFARHGHLAEQQMVVACNLTPVVRHGYRLGVPQAGVWRAVLNTDSTDYGGSGVGPGEAQQPPEAAKTMAELVPWQGQPASVVVSLPPLGVLWLESHQDP